MTVSVPRHLIQSPSSQKANTTTTSRYASIVQEIKSLPVNDDTPSKPSPTLNANAECSVTTKRTQVKTPLVANKRRQTRSQAVTHTVEE